MEPDIEESERLHLYTVTQLRMDALMKELTKRVMVVNEDSLTHLLQRGVIAPVARDGCCKPDGGTCCPNKRLRVEVGGTQRVLEP